MLSSEISEGRQLIAALVGLAVGFGAFLAVDAATQRLAQGGKTVRFLRRAVVMVALYTITLAVVRAIGGPYVFKGSYRGAYHESPLTWSDVFLLGGGAGLLTAVVGPLFRGGGADS